MDKIKTAILGAIVGAMAGALIGIVLMLILGDDSTVIISATVSGAIVLTSVFSQFD